MHYGKVQKHSTNRGCNLVVEDGSTTQEPEPDPTQQHLFASLQRFNIINRISIEELLSISIAFFGMSIGILVTTLLNMI